MKRLIVTALLVVVASAGPLMAQSSPRKYALLIGLNSYLRSMTVPPLRYAEADVDGLKTSLANLGYDVRVIRSDEATRARIIAELYRLTADVRDTDDFLLYYAGHGVRNRLPSRKTFWLTYDADLENLDVSSIRLEHLLDYVQEIRAKHTLILLDHCFSGDIVLKPFEAPAVGGAATPPAPAAGAPGAAATSGNRSPISTVDLERGAFPVGEIKKQLEPRSAGEVIITAARAGAIESATLSHGVFTTALLQALGTREADTNGDARLSIKEMETFVKTRTADLGRQMAGVEQDVDVRDDGVNLDSWIVADNLPIAEAAEAVQKLTAYHSTLDTWEQKGLITNNTKLRCLQWLLEWKAAIEAKRTQSESERARVTRVRQLLDGPAGLEMARADDLSSYVSAQPGP
jgi:uncharacterized caspase-like protein